MEKQVAKEKSFEGEMVKTSPSQLMAALVVYEVSNAEKESTVHWMMEATSWTRALAEYYYYAFKSDGINTWRKEVKSLMGNVNDFNNQ